MSIRFTQANFSRWNVDYIGPRFVRGRECLTVIQLSVVVGIEIDDASDQPVFTPVLFAVVVRVEEDCPGELRQLRLCEIFIGCAFGVRRELSRSFVMKSPASFQG